MRRQTYCRALYSKREGARTNTDGHVIMPDFKLVNGEPKLEFVKIGRNEASTFTGLCSKHDTELFKLIDAEPLDVDNCEHLQQLAYRSVMREYHTHLLNAERANAFHEKICKADGSNPTDAVTAYSFLYLQHMDKAREVYSYRNRHFDTPLSEGKMPDLGHFIVTMAGQPPVLAASALFSTGFTSDGKIIGPTLNVLPLSKNESVAVLSYPAWQMFEIRTALEKLFYADEQTLKYELAKIIVHRVESFVLCPAHYEKWSDNKKARVLREFEATMTEPAKEIADHQDLNIFL